MPARGEGYRLPPSPLQLVPRGLAAFLGLKAQDAMPQRFANENLLATWELRDHYEFTNGKVNAQSLAYTAGAGSTTLMLSPLTIPTQGFVFVTDLRWSFSFQNAADAMTGMPALLDPVLNPAAPFPIGLAPTEYVYPAGAIQQFLGCLPGGFWMPPGASLVWWSRQSINTAGAATLRFTCRFADYGPM